ncbi:DUF2301 domain-containing membrane protein [Prochlorococcus marinus]|uniref:DUF2301 domain-containing membrane protein n=1 Tax=Prochlorococcus marinus TaxID=1219 RepID=UPI0022B4C42F|nr:DUF2301 domain-containing membrane protein [Prochlorococcus marinus]
MNTALEKEYEGIYGKYKITSQDQKEVQLYRISLFICGISFISGLINWLLIGPNYVWIWLLILSISLGFALKWIHIYISFLHKTLQALSALGLIGLSILLLTENPSELLPNISSNPLLSLLIGPTFAALTGLGFKEFFCFRRPEAIGLTLLLPLSILSHLFNFFSNEIIMFLLISSAMLLTILAIRKFGMDAASDIGDKSVFEFLKRTKAEEAF